MLVGSVVHTGAVSAMKPEAIAVGAPQDGRWKNNLNFHLFYAYPYNRKESMDEGFTYSDLAVVRRSRRHANDVIRDFRRPASA